MTDDEEHASLLKTRSAEAARLGALYHETPEVANLRLWWGLCYANAMGVCGIVLVALGSTLSALAADCGTTETAVGTVFIARGIGAITGALGSARLYAPPRRGNAVMVVVLLLLSVVLLYMPFVRDVWVLHATWFLLGACTATLDTGCQIMTRSGPVPPADARTHGGWPCVRAGGARSCTMRWWARRTSSSRTRRRRACAPRSTGGTRSATPSKRSSRPCVKRA